MDDSFGVRRVQRVSILNGQFEGLVERQRLTRSAVLQGLAIEELHGNEWLAIVFTDVVDGADVGVVQGGGGLGFPSEASK